MKIKQLQCVQAVYENGFSVTKAARLLHLSQPAVSKQIKSLEEQLETPIFERGHKSLTGLTEFGVQIMPLIEDMLKIGDEILDYSNQQQQAHNSMMHFATTNTLATYRLAPMMSDIQAHFPEIPFHIIEGTNTQILQMLTQREADLGWISAVDLTPYNQYLTDLTYLLAPSWTSVLVVPDNHPFAKHAPSSLAEICEYPLITYVTSYKGQSAMVKHMQSLGLSAKVVLTARSSDMIKNYVRQGLGIGVIADMAFDVSVDLGLVGISLENWLPSYQTYLLWHRHKRLKNYHYYLMQKINPSLNESMIKKAALSTVNSDSWVI